MLQNTERCTLQKKKRHPTYICCIKSRAGAGIVKGLQENNQLYYHILCQECKVSYREMACMPVCVFVCVRECVCVCIKCSAFICDSPDIVELSRRTEGSSLPSLPSVKEGKLIF